MQDQDGALQKLVYKPHELYSIDVMWVKRCHKPPMTGNDKHTTFKHGDLGGGLFLFLPTLSIISPIVYLYLTSGKLT